MSTFGLDGKSVVITGASSGKGKAATLAFAREGYKLTMIAQEKPMRTGKLTNASNVAVAHPRLVWLMSDSKHEEAASAFAQRLVGTWRLVSFTQNGQPHPAYGRKPSGFIRYDRNGDMAVQIMPDPAHPHSPAVEPITDVAKAIPGYIAYFGRYSVDERAQTITHHRQGNLMPGEPVAAVRRYEFLPADRLALILDEDPTSQVLWQRVR